MLGSSLDQFVGSSKKLMLLTIQFQKVLKLSVDWQLERLNLVIET